MDFAVESCPSIAKLTSFVSRPEHATNAAEAAATLPRTALDFMSPHWSYHPILGHSRSHETNCFDIFGVCSRRFFAELCVQNPIFKAAALPICECTAPSHLP